MNKIPLNIAGLDGGVIIKKGGGGGVTINNQEKSVDITENGVTEVTADAGFTGLSKVIVNTNVASSGGGGGSDMPVIGDGKTYLYITIAAEGRMDVPLYFNQSVANGVTIDWGDGSAPETLSGTGYLNTKHKYAAIGDYVISLDPVEGCTLDFGANSKTYSVIGVATIAGLVYCNMLKGVEIGRGVTSIGNYAFNSCYSLASVVIPEGVTSIGNYAFDSCYSLASVVIPEGVTSIGEASFKDCRSLDSVTIPNSVTSIAGYAFDGCSSLDSVVISNGVTSIETATFRNCYSLASVVVPDGVTIIKGTAFDSCYSLASVVIPDSVTDIEGAFGSCYSLASVVFPNSVTSIVGSTFYRDDGIAFYDFSSMTSIPTIGSSVFSNISTNFKIIVPDALYDEWQNATNWSAHYKKIIKKSDWDAQS